MIAYALLKFFLFALIIVLTGYFLTKCADAISERTNLGRAFIGSVFLAGATSLPELFVGVSAIKTEAPDLAVGNLFGSSLFNLMILAVADLMHRNTKSMFSSSAQSHTISALMCINVMAVAAIVLLASPLINFPQIGGVSLPLLFIFLSYIMSMRLIYCNQRLQIKSPVLSGSKVMGLSQATIGYLSSALILLIVAPYVAESAEEIARLTGLKNSFVGTTLLAFATTLPELVSTTTAVRMGAFDMAIGNIFGSNAFNMMLLIPLDFFHPGALLASVSPTHALTALATIITSSVASMGQLYQVEKRIKFIEPDALLIITLTLGFLFVLYLI